MTRTNRQWLLASRPDGEVKVENFAWREQAVPEPRDGEFLLRTIYLSLDPTNRAWMNAADTYLPAIPLGEVMRGIGIGIVEESRHPGFSAGDLVQGLPGWQTYALSDGTGYSKLPPAPVPLEAHFALLGHIGLTAHYGLLEIGEPKQGETLVVSAAAGAVGSLVGQIGKLKGCRVVGIAGGEKKCAWIRDDLRFDAAIDYRNEDVFESLRKHCPQGIDIYFDNVGGPILDAVLPLINNHARIPLCGMISQYNSARPSPGPSNLAMLIIRRARMQGFIILDHLANAAPAVRDLVTWYAEGKLRYRTEMVEGIENAPEALLKLFSGQNTGKLLVKVSGEP
jgi:NADPH-dependent curcumin reductase CurA